MYGLGLRGSECQGFRIVQVLGLEVLGLKDSCRALEFTRGMCYDVL